MGNFTFEDDDLAGDSNDYMREVSARQRRLCSGLVPPVLEAEFTLWENARRPGPAHVRASGADAMLRLCPLIPQHDVEADIRRAEEEARKNLVSAFSKRKAPAGLRSSLSSRRTHHASPLPPPSPLRPLPRRPRAKRAPAGPPEGWRASAQRWRRSSRTWGRTSWATTTTTRCDSGEEGLLLVAAGQCPAVSMAYGGSTLD